MNRPPNAIPLPYAATGPRPARTQGWACVWYFVACLGLPAPLVLTLPRMPHDALCPNCGGWGAAALIAAMAGVLCLGIFVTIRAIRARAGVASLLLACSACAIAGFYLAVAIAFYFAIQA